MQPPKAPPTSGARDEQPIVTQDIAAEAAVWLARLHGPDRSRAMERACLAWQARSEAHRLAFERSTDLWQDAAGARRAHVPASRHDDQRSRADRGTGRRTALALAALGGVAALTCCLWPNDTYGTGVGEQRLIVLADGSRLTLNTSTTVRVNLTKKMRAVTVERGEALFEVAKDPGRPFVVSVADADVVATGTAFLVRASPQTEPGEDAFGVTLLEGQVIVRPTGDVVQSALNSPVVMTHGERLRVGRVGGERGRLAGMGARVDRPSIDSLLAWKRGLVVLDDVSLADAIADMNRYSRVQVMLGHSEALAAMRVSGAFRAGDNEAFARAVATLHGLAVRPTGGAFELAEK